MRLIDADKFRMFLDRQYHNCHGYSGNKKEIYREALRAVKSYVHSAGQIDAVPVVRCKDCKYFKTLLCENEDSHDDWFCADGERKNEVSE